MDGGWRLTRVVEARLVGSVVYPVRFVYTLFIMYWYVLRDGRSWV